MVCSRCVSWKKKNIDTSSIKKEEEEEEKKRQRKKEMSKAKEKTIDTPGIEIESRKSSKAIFTLHLVTSF